MKRRRCGRVSGEQGLFPLAEGAFRPNRMRHAMWAAMALLTACTAPPPTGPHPLAERVLDAATEPATRTALEGMRVVWAQGDTIGVFAGAETHAPFKLVAGCEGSTEGRFRGELPQAAEPEWIYYPYDRHATLQQGEVLLRLSEVQRYAPASFGPRTNPSAAFVAQHGTVLRNLCGVLRLRVTGERTLQSVVFAASGGEAVAGPATLGVDAQGEAQLLMSAQGSRTLTLDCGAGVALDPAVATDLLLVLPPGDYQGFSITLRDTQGGAMRRSASQQVCIARSQITPMAPFAYEPTDADLSLGGRANCYLIPAEGDYSFDASAAGEGEQALPLFEEGYEYGADWLWAEGEAQVSQVRLEGKRIALHAGAGEGSCIVALYRMHPGGRFDRIVWTWHLWFSDARGHDYAAAGEWLDRNLGARSTLPHAAASYGFLYQFGRRDPMIGSQVAGSTAYPAYNHTLESAAFSVGAEEGSAATAPTRINTAAFPAALTRWNFSKTLNTTVQGSARYPLAFFGGRAGTYLWSLDSPLGAWGSQQEKGLYDPCPAGWRVPTRAQAEVLATLLSSAQPHGSAGALTHGRWYDLPQQRSVRAWWPAAGIRRYGDAKLAMTGSSGWYWCADLLDAATGKAACLTLGEEAPALEAANLPMGFSVRCVRE